MKLWWLLFLAMKFTFLFLNLAKIHIFIPKCAEGRGLGNIPILKKKFLTSSLISHSYLSFLFCREHNHLANLEGFFVSSLVVDLKVLLQHHLVVHLVTLATQFVTNAIHFVIRIWPNRLIDTWQVLFVTQKINNSFDS